MLLVSGEGLLHACISSYYGQKIFSRQNGQQNYRFKEQNVDMLKCTRCGNKSHSNDQNALLLRHTFLDVGKLVKTKICDLKQLK